MTRFVANDPGHRGSAIHVHRLFERGIDAAGHVTHVVAADLPGAVGKAVRIQVGCAVEQQTRAFDRVAGDRDDPRFLALHVSGFVGIDDASYLARCIVLDLHSHAVRTYFEVAGRLALRDFAIERRPLRAGLAALEAEADLLAGAAAVARFAV